MGLWQTLRRRYVDRQPCPEEWKRILHSRISQYRTMPSHYRNKLDQLVRYFMNEKSFEGCGGFDLDNEKKLIISALACIPLLGDVSNLYPNLRSVLVYPSDYRVSYSDYGYDGVVTEGVEHRSGESWDQGTLVFSWSEILYDLRHPLDGSNIVFHECAHQLDYEWGATMGTLSWRNNDKANSRASGIKMAYEKLLSKIEKGQPVYVDGYASTDVHEFFAVMTETWLEQPGIIRRHWPEMEEILRGFYNFQPEALW